VGSFYGRPRKLTIDNTLVLIQHTRSLGMEDADIRLQLGIGELPRLFQLCYGGGADEHRRRLG
jgi:hypothetical protein